MEEEVLYASNVSSIQKVYDKVYRDQAYSINYIDDKDSIDIKQGSKFYISKETVISRHNVRMLTEKFNSKIVRDIEKADFILVDDNVLYKKREYLYVNHDAKLISKRWFRAYKGSKYGFVYEKDILDILKYPSKIVHINVISSLLYENVDLPIIDEEQHKVLDSMLSSTNKSDVELAVTLMCNCNSDKSISYIYNLLCNYKWTIKNHRLHTNVKFRTLMHYLGEKDVLDFAEDKLLKLLISKNLLTKYHLNAIMENVKHSVKDFIVSKYGSEDIVFTLSITDELKTQVLKNEVNPAQLNLFDGK